uniref:Uncharacterized protein n=1 Tax=Panagrolaimus davidi TaxID=227884 RepID=A0A914R3I6_9BILA
MCIIEAECSNLENENQGKRSPEELFAKILKSINEYTTEKAEVLLLNKSKLLTILKSYRPLKIGNYIYGLTLNLLKKKRLIVFEWNDKRRIREYSYTKRPNLWTCRECFRLNDHHNQHRPYTYLYLVNGIVFVSIKHDCVPRDYNLVMQYQKFLEEGDTSKARSMSRTISFAFGQDFFANVVNFVEDFSASLSKDSTIDTNKIAALSGLKRKLNDNECVSTAEKVPANKK